MAILTLGFLVAACTAPDGSTGDHTGHVVGWESGVVSWSATTYPAGTQQYVIWQVFGEPSPIMFGDGFMVNHSAEEVRIGLTRLDARSPYVGDPPSGEFLAYEVIARLGAIGWELVDVEYGTHLVTSENMPRAEIRWYLRRPMVP